MVCRVDLEFGLFYRLLAGNNRQLSKAVHTAGFLAADIVSRVESLYLTSKFCLKGLRVTEGNVINSRLTGNKTFPGSFHVQTKRTQSPYTGNHHSIVTIAYQIYLPNLLT